METNDAFCASFKDAMELSQDHRRLIGELQRLGVLHKKMACSSCTTSMRLQENTRFALDGFCWRCTKKECKKTTSLRKESYFSDAHIPLGVCFMIIYCYMKYDKMLLRYIADIVGTSERTMNDWANFIRESISHYFLVNPLILGTSHAVQIDESLFGGRRKYNRGDHHKHVKSWVFGMIEEETRLCVFWTVNDRKKDTLLSIIREHIAEGSTIKSDEWAAYSSLNDEGFKHLTVNHSIQFVNNSGIHTQLIESTWSQIKSILKVKRGTSKDFLPGYLDFYSFLMLAKHKKMSTFNAFLEIIQAGSCY
jgi:hypothetical protein